MANPFGAVKVTAPGKSVFTLTHEKQLTMGIGTLIPIFSKMVNAGEKFKIQSEFMLRMNPLIAPVMGRMNVDIHYFFCKHTDLWSKFYEFMSGVDNLGNEFTAVNPFCVKWWQYYDALCAIIETTGRVQKIHYNYYDVYSFAGTILDYLGYPSLLTEDCYNYYVNNGSTQQFWSDFNEYDSHYFNLFPLFDYQKIYYEYYSKESFEDDVFSKILDGITTFYLREDDKNVFDIIITGQSLSPAMQDFANLVNQVIPDEYQVDAPVGSLLRWLITPHLRKYANDYFTSANPWTQKGQAPKVPITGTLNPQSDFSLEAQNILINETAEWIPTGRNTTTLGSANTAEARVSLIEASSSVEGYFNISDLRIATAVQRLLEKFATAGTRINEYLRSVFGTSDPSLELGRALYLGGTSTPMEISTIFQSSESNQTPLGDMGGKGMSAGVSPFVTYKVPQHGVIIGIMSIRPKLVYDNVIERELTYFDRFDYPTPDLQHVGEQAIYNYELNAPMTSGEGEFVTLGYQQRYGEAKYIPSTRHGEIKRFHSLEYWSAYNPSDSPESISQLIAVNPLNYGKMFNYVGLSEDDTRSQLIVHILNKVSAKRPLSFYSTPSL